MNEGDIPPRVTGKSWLFDPVVPVPRHVVFSHGLDGEPWGYKISALAQIARAENYQVTSVDYRGISEPQARIGKLVETCRELQGELVLVGSSLGAYVSLAAAALMHTQGIFLMAPAIYMKELPALPRRIWECPCTVVHAWEDDIVPVDHSIRFAREHNCPLHIVSSDHRLHNRMPIIIALFEQFLYQLPVRPDQV